VEVDARRSEIDQVTIDGSRVYQRSQDLSTPSKTGNHPSNMLDK